MNPADLDFVIRSAAIPQTIHHSDVSACWSLAWRGVADVRFLAVIEAGSLGNVWIDADTTVV